MRNVSDKFEEKIETHVLRSVTFFLENLAFYEMTCNGMVDQTERRFVNTRRHSQLSNSGNSTRNPLTK
jgi:hypothetical protein